MNVKRFFIKITQTNRYILKIQCVLLLLILTLPCQGKSVVKWDGDTLTIDNDVVRRTVVFSGNSVSTTELALGSDPGFIGSGADEFYFELNEKGVAGSGPWQLVKQESVQDENMGQGAAVTIRGLENELENLEVTITYLLYPGLPVIRKNIAFLNRGKDDIKIESLDVEYFKLRRGDTHSWIMTNYARQRRLGPYVGNWNDPAVIVHDIRGRKGIVLGNEAPGVIKRTSAYVDGSSATIGLTHTGQDYAFRKWLKPGEEWKSPWVFIALYSDTDDPFSVMNGPVNDFVRKHMGIRLAKKQEKPVFVYNTWNPFRTNVNEELVKELARAAAACGVEEFIIDDGWQTNRGDWEIDTQKFPNGLKPVFDYIRSLGMKPGLWISLTTADTISRVYQQHPEWFVQDKNGDPENLHGAYTQEYVTGCFATGWYDHIKKILLDLIREHGLAYFKLDLTIVTSAYIYDREVSGCYAKDHPLHRDRNESFLVIYRRCMDLFDDLHKTAPELFIDCTFETWGTLQLVDYALVKHAEGDWLVNVEQPVPLGSSRIRNLAWWRSPAMPAASLVIGNLTLDDPGSELSFKSLAGTLPIMLGDPRKLSEEKQSRLKQWADWLRDMQKKHDYMMYRQDLPGFGEPLENQWDGWMRINTDTKSGGLVGVFRQGGIENSRIVTIPGLLPDAVYSVKKGPGGDEILESTGRALVEKGLPVQLNEKYDGILFEVTLE
ncbi:alpha-galactosidase [candidate division KSB1 bacterium]|nr:alpha-galactosidase [candidate division KSB1 bacterium]